MVLGRKVHDKRSPKRYGELVSEGRKYYVVLVNGRRLRVWKSDLRYGKPK